MNNGDGLRCVVWLSGCNHHCKNCFNREAWDFNYGGGNNMKKNLANFLHLTSLSQGEAMAESILQNANKIGVLE